MRVIVIGAGKLGYSIAELLSKESFDVVIVDHNAAQLEGPKNTLDVLTIHANGASPITMNEVAKPSAIAQEGAKTVLLRTEC